MLVLSVVLTSVVVSFVHGSWISDLTSSRGLGFGDGVFLKLEDTKAGNASVLEGLGLRLDNDNVGVSMSRSPKKEAVQLDFYVKDQVEGRGKKMGNMVLPFLMGAAGGGAMTLGFGSVKVVIMKALMLAKLAMLLSVILLLGKLMKEVDTTPKHVEVEQHAASEVYPVYTEYSQHSAGGGNGYNNPSGGGGYGGYPYGPSAAESVVNYATVEAPGGNGSAATVPVMQPVIPAGKRRDIKRRSRPMVLTITHITKPDKDGLL